MQKAILFFILHILLPLQAQEQLPILAFHGVQSGKVEDYRKLKEAGFNISLDVYHNTADALRHLDAAEKAGVKLFIYSDSLMLHPSKIINRIMNHPAFYGTYVADEPSADQFQMLRWRIANIKEYDRKGKFYVNLFPSYASEQQLGIGSYDLYLNKYVSEVPVDFISFDYYPVQKNRLDPRWYKNLEDIRNLSVEAGKPFWGFANSTVFGPHEQPTLAELKLQQFGNLLYGAKGLQYFGYWTLDKTYRNANNFKHSVVYEDGSPTPTYNLVKSLNTQIQRLSWIFTNGTVKSIYHHGTAAPVGTHLLKGLPVNFSTFNPQKHPVLVSYITADKLDFIIVQNKNINSSITFTYKLIKAATIIDSQTGLGYIAGAERSSISVLPGDLLIFQLP